MAKAKRLYDDILREELDVWVGSASYLRIKEAREEAEELFVSVGMIDDYLAIRDNPRSDDSFRAMICLGRYIELTPKLAKLAEDGFPKHLLERLNQGDLSVHDELALFLLRHELHCRTTPKIPHSASLGRTFKPSDINFLVALMIEQCSVIGKFPNSLIYLNGLRLLGENNKHRKDFRFHRFAMTVFGVFQECLQNGRAITLRSLARILEVKHTSLARQREQLKEHWDALSDETGEYWLFADERSGEGPLPEHLKAGPVQFPDI